MNLWNRVSYRARCRCVVTTCPAVAVLAVAVLIASGCSDYRSVAPPTGNSGGEESGTVPAGDETSPAADGTGTTEEPTEKPADSVFRMRSGAATVAVSGLGRFSQSTAIR